MAFLPVPLFQRLLGTSSMATTLIPGVYNGPSATQARLNQEQITRAQLIQSQGFLLAANTTSTTSTGLYQTTLSAQDTRAQSVYIRTSTNPETGAVSSYLSGTPTYEGLVATPQRFVKYCRLDDSSRDGSVWADFGQEEGGEWLIICRHLKDGTVLTYPEKDFSRDSTCLNPGNHFLERIEKGEGHTSNFPIPLPTYDPSGHPMKRQEALAQETAQVKEERHQIYTKLQEKVQKIEQILGLSGEAKSTGELLSALAERVQEIEDYLENRP